MKMPFFLKLVAILGIVAVLCAGAAASKYHYRDAELASGQPFKYRDVSVRNLGGEVDVLFEGKVYLLSPCKSEVKRGKLDLPPTRSVVAECLERKRVHVSITDNEFRKLFD